MLPVAVNVSDPAVLTFHGVPLVPVMLIVLFVSVSVRVPDVETKKPQVTVLPLVLRVPAETMRVRVLSSVNASCKVQPPPEPLKMTVPCSVTPAPVIVFPVEVEVNVNDPYPTCNKPVTKVKLPAIATLATDILRVGTPLVPGNAQVMSAHNAKTSTVTVYAVALDSAVKWQLSLAVGTEPVATPPSLVAQLPVFDQLFDPPTQ